MTTALADIDRLSAARRPVGRPAGYHRWQRLLFVHWRCDPELIAPLIPPGLSLDTFEGSAWVGLVPFSISGLRPWWSPPVPGARAFNEVNVRTYVHYRRRDPGVWFFSLDATNRLAVAVARAWWGLNYHFAKMSVRSAGDLVHYEAARRLRRGRAAAHIVAQVGPKLGDDDANRPLPPGLAVPDTLDHFLIERYLLYSQRPSGPLFRGQVHHAPYQLHEVSLLSCEQSLLTASGIRPNTPPYHAVYSPGVDVEVFPLRRV